MESLEVKTLKYLVNNTMNVNLDMPTRKYRYIKARAICYKILREQNNMSYSMIGRFFNKTHGTIIHAIKEFDSMVAYDKAMKEDYNNILNVWGRPLEAKNKYVDALDLVIKIDMQKSIKQLHKQNKILSLNLLKVQDQLNKILEPA
tara:strand:- start:4847 stop:5284 length:438 start_codon:yes stop_codon:yes gene_type:complete